MKIKFVKPTFLIVLVLFLFVSCSNEKKSFAYTTWCFYYLYGPKDENGVLLDAEKPVDCWDADCCIEFIDDSRFRFSAVTHIGHVIAVPEELEVEKREYDPGQISINSIETQEEEDALVNYIASQSMYYKTPSLITFSGTYDVDYKKHKKPHLNLYQEDGTKIFEFDLEPYYDIEERLHLSTDSTPWNIIKNANVYRSDNNLYNVDLNPTNSRDFIDESLLRIALENSVWRMPSIFSVYQPALIPTIPFITQEEDGRVSRWSGWYGGVIPAP